MHEARRTIVSKFEPIKEAEHYEMSKVLQQDDKLLSK